MKGIIVYKSNYGSTEQYARWIEEETSFPCLEAKRVRKADLEKADTVIVGCPIYAANPLLAKWLNKNWHLLREKKVLFYTTSGAPGDDPNLIKGYEKALSEEIRRVISYFPLGGRMIFDDLKPFMKFMMNMVKRMTKDPAEREKITADIDRMDREGLKPLLAALG
jgi:menaquinone-dependent protoporphyrinogen IX oxidase